MQAGDVLKFFCRLLRGSGGDCLSLTKQISSLQVTRPNMRSPYD
jgi:hypothetical protein